MTILYLDCSSGASGDMLLAALVDAGAPEQRVRDALDALPVRGWQLQISTVTRGGIRAARAEVTCDAETAAERTLADVIAILGEANLPQEVAKRSIETFEALADAEGRIHDIDPFDVRFHELGSLDAIIDVVACCAAFSYFDPERVVTSPIASGSGWVDSAHGPIPLPAPAVIELLQGRGAVLFGRGHQELVTPTAAALLTSFTNHFGDLPSIRLEASGYGAGTRELEHPNVLRVLVGSAPLVGGRQREAQLIQANVDDMSPELVPHLMDSLLEAGAQDAWVTPIVMKKGRPGLTLSVLADPTQHEPMTDILYREATTLGVRVISVTKEELERRSIEVEIEGHPVRVKVGLREGRAVNSSPEHDDALAVARATGLPLKQVYTAALRAADKAQLGSSLE